MDNPLVRFHQQHVAVLSLGSHVRKLPGMWACDYCGVQKPLTHYLRQRRYCSRSCRGMDMRGKDNPAYKNGSRAARKGQRRYVRLTDQQIGEIRLFMAKRRSLASLYARREAGLDVKAEAARLGCSTRVFYHYSSEKHWINKVAP